MRLKLISNFERLDKPTASGIRVELIKYPTARPLLFRVIATFLLSLRADYIVLNGQTRDLLGLALLRSLLPFLRCKLVSVDLMLSPPQSPASRALHWIKVIALKKVDVFVLYFKNTRGYEDAFGIDKSKIRFVPFKVNALEIIRTTDIADHGYVFTGGMSRRDYDTFLRAVSQLPFPTKMIAGTTDTLTEHDSLFDGSLVPSHVEILPGSPAEDFVSIMGHSRVVVIPLKKGTLAPAGLSVCLQAMALRKCVIISAVSAVESLLPDDTAILVPPAEPDALKEAIERACLDSDLRERVAAQGYRYASSLGDDDRLMASLLDLLHQEKMGTGTPTTMEA
jgi:glycosyltransferase involved in cell wall biosynthesis